MFFIFFKEVLRRRNSFVFVWNILTEVVFYWLACWSCPFEFIRVIISMIPILLRIDNDISVRDLPCNGFDRGRNNTIFMVDLKVRMITDKLFKLI